MEEIVCGVFPSRGQAETALEALMNAGFSRAALGSALKVTGPAVARAAAGSERNLYTFVPNQRVVDLPQLGNALVGGTIEGCLAGGPAQRSLSDALGCLGIQAEHARWYVDMVRAGNVLITLRTGDSAKAQAIMKQFGSLQVAPVERPPDSKPSVAAPDRTPAGSAAELGAVGMSQVERQSSTCDIQPGFDVYTSDGLKVGTIHEAASNCIHIVVVQDIFLSPDRIGQVEPGRVSLNVSSGEINDLDWYACQPEPSVGSEPGGPGTSGVVPQEHEVGVHIPIEPSD